MTSNLSSWITAIVKDNAHLLEMDGNTPGVYYDSEVAGLVADAKRAFKSGDNHRVVTILTDVEELLLRHF